VEVCGRVGRCAEVSGRQGRGQKWNRIGRSGQEGPGEVRRLWKRVEEAERK